MKLNIPNQFANNTVQLAENDRFLADNSLAWMADTLDPTGFLSRTTSTLSWDDGTYTLTITPTGSTFPIYINGVKYNKKTESVAIDNSTTGQKWIYYNDAGTLTASNTIPSFASVWVAQVYWNATTSKGLVGDERHGIKMDFITHGYLHYSVGTRYVSGLTGTFADATFTITTGQIYDEDIALTIAEQTTCNVLYKDGSAEYKWLAGQTAYYYTSGGNLYYDNGNTLTAVPANQYVAYWIFATNDTTTPIISLMGQRVDVNITDARNNNKYDGLTLGTLPFQEMKLLYRVILRNDATPYEETQDLRSISNLPATSFVATQHNALTGLNWAVAGHTMDADLVMPDNIKVLFGTGNDASIYYNGTDLIVNPVAVGTGLVRFQTGAGSAVVIENTNGAVTYSATDVFRVYGINAKFELTSFTYEPSTGSAITIIENAYGAGANWTFQRAGGTKAVPTSIANGNIISQVDFKGYHTAGTPAYYTGARIQATVDASIGASAEMPMRLGFFTCPDASTTALEALRITSGQVVKLDHIGELTAAHNIVFDSNPTFAGRTIPDLGIVTTVDLNGGTIDGTAIGSASASTGAFTTLTASSTVNFTDASARTTDLTNNIMGSVATPITTDMVYSFKAQIYATGSSSAIAGGYFSQGIGANKGGSGVVGFISTHASDNVASYLNAFNAVIDGSGGSVGGTNALFAGNAGSGVFDFIINSTAGANFQLYEAVNDANPTWTFGASATERFSIQTVYDTGAQTLNYVQFQTYAASATADKGKYVFGVDGTDVVTINDTGIVCNGTISTPISITLNNGATDGGAIYFDGGTTTKYLKGNAGGTILSTDLSLQFDSDNVDILDPHGLKILTLSHVGTAVNKTTITNAAAGSGPIISATGNDTDIGINLESKGDGVNTTKRSCADTTNLYTALAVSAFTSDDAADGFGTGVVFRIKDAAGSLSNLGTIGMVRNGADNIGKLLVYVNRAAGQKLLLEGETVDSSVNYLKITSAISGASPSFSVVGSDTDIDLLLTPQGAGVLKFGTYTAGAATDSTGYITIKDAAGNTRKLMVQA